MMDKYMRMFDKKKYDLLGLLMKDFARLKNMSDRALSVRLENTPFLRLSLEGSLDGCDEIGLDSYEIDCSVHVAGRRDTPSFGRNPDELSSVGKSARFRSVLRLFIGDSTSGPERETHIEACNIK
jgi:hypothetical protein